MLVESKKLHNLKVETESGQEIGKLSGFEIETESQSIINYKVSPTKILKISSEDLVVNRGQVLGINEKKMVVDDSVIKAKQSNKEKVANKKTAPMPAMKTVNRD